MNALNPKRIWFWIAVAAIAFALIALLLPHTGSAADQQSCLALLPVFFVGLITPLCVRSLLAVLTANYAPQAPTLATLSQRPPPASLA